MIRRGALVAATVAIVLLTGAVHARIPSVTRAQRGEAFVPRPELVGHLSLGFDALLADYYWLQAVQVVGGDTRNPSQHATHLGRLIDVVTTLDPWVDHPYRFAAVWLTDSEQNVRTANRLLERGIAHHPHDWRNVFYLGFNHFFYLLDNATAAHWLEQAIELEGAPMYLPRLVARLRSEADDLESAALFLEQLVRDAQDDETRAHYQAALDEIEVEYKARVLDAARRTYSERNGRDITSVEDLVRGAQPVLGRLPDPEPSSLPAPLGRGSVWELDLESDVIQSTYYGRRYKVNFHPRELERSVAWKRARETETGQSNDDE